MSGHLQRRLAALEAARTEHRPYLAAGDAAQREAAPTPDAATMRLAAAAMAAQGYEDGYNLLSSMATTIEAEQPAPEHGELWSLLDWSLWGAGMADVFREPLADTMLAAVPAQMVKHAEAIMADFIKRREIKKTGVTIYQEQRDELAALRKRVAELEQATPPALTAAERTFLTFALDLASDRMASRGREFGDDDWTTLASLRKLAGGES